MVYAQKIFSKGGRGKMKGWEMKLTAVVVALAFMVGFSGMLTGHAYAQEKGAAAAGKAGAEAGAATAAGISTGTIVAGVIAAAAIAAIAAASGGGGGAVSVPTTAPTASSVASSLASAGLSASDMLGLYDALSDSTFQSILSTISYDDLVAALKDLGVLTAGKEDLKNWLNQLKSKNPDLYNRVVNVLKTLAQNKTLFEQVQAMVKDPQKLKEFKSAVQKQVETLLTQKHPGYTVQFTTVHHGGGVYTTQYHLVKKQ